jgi:hypothetical protein
VKTAKIVDRLETSVLRIKITVNRFSPVTHPSASTTGSCLTITSRLAILRVPSANVTWRVRVELVSVRDVVALIVITAQLRKQGTMEAYQLHRSADLQEWQLQRD